MRQGEQITVSVQRLDSLSIRATLSKQCFALASILSTTPATTLPARAGETMVGG
jgi:hypothetical protein